MDKKTCEILDQINSAKDYIERRNYDLERFENADTNSVDVHFRWKSGDVEYSGNYYLKEKDAERLFDYLKRKELLLIESCNKKIDNLVEELKGGGNNENLHTKS